MAGLESGAAAKRPPPPPSKKKRLLVRLYSECVRRGALEFGKEEVREAARAVGFGNPFDATKVDHSDLLPDELRRDDIALVRLGKGRFTFVRGIRRVYHALEPVQEKIKDDYTPSLLNHTDTSESSILSTAFNQRILHKILYGNLSEGANLYMSRRTKMPLAFRLGDSRFESEAMQMEMDMALENRGRVTVFEGKNGFRDDFNLFQLYNPFRYFLMLKEEQCIAIDSIDCCYAARVRGEGEHTLRFHLYRFNDPETPESIELLKAHEFRLIVKQ